MSFFYYFSRTGNTNGSHDGPMTQDTRIALFLMGELVAALRANDPDLFKRWLFGGLSMSVWVVEANRDYKKAVAPGTLMSEEKESINENISDEELESVTGGSNRGDLKREVQERNRARDRRHRLRRNL